MSLADLAALLDAHGVETHVRYASDSTVDDFRAAVQRNLSNEGDFVVVNYQREGLGQGRMGHISPLAAYDANTDRALILDTARHKYPPTWVPLEALYEATEEVDSASGESRGCVEVSLAP